LCQPHRALYGEKPMEKRVRKRRNFVLTAVWPPSNKLIIDNSILLNKRNISGSK
jgi:hypothetical protein